MRDLASRSILLATAFALAGCGGGGGGISSIGSTPPPAPPPPPPPPSAFVLIPEATTSQQFAVAGATHLAAGDGTPQLAAADQLQIRYVASSNSYEIELPTSQTWIGLTGKSQLDAAGGGVAVVIQKFDYRYSSIFDWTGSNSLGGAEAVGIATPTGAVPVTGTATYAAYALGRTSESSSSGRQIFERLVLGTMTLNFDFAHGSLSGSLSSLLDPEWNQYDLGTLNFRDTVYSAGSTTFSGRFDTNIAGVNSFSGLFTGPNAQEVIGNWAFPYLSPADGRVYQADGAFVGAK
jgi:hypothetical protein